MKYIIALLGLLFATLGLSLESVYADFSALVGGTLVIVTFLKQMPQVKDLLAVVAAWGTGIALTVIGYYAGLGFLLDRVLFPDVILIAIGASLAANGFYSAVKAVLKAFGIIKE